MSTNQPTPDRADRAASPVGVGDVTRHLLPVVVDPRGNLTVGEFERDIPFAALRYFMVYGVPSRQVRGEHAHHRCQQFLICVSGSCTVAVDDGSTRREILLDDINQGLYLPPLVWGAQYNFSRDAVLLVFASDYYDNADYIRSYDEFLTVVGRLSAAQ